MVSKVSATVIVCSIWLAFILLYFAFLSGFLTLVQDVLVVLASMVITRGIFAAIWVHESSES